MRKDPLLAGPRPPFTGFHVSLEPGGGERLDPTPDHGEFSYRGSGRLAGSAAIVTEADSGIGRAIAIAFAREGADVLVACMRDREGAQETIRWVEDAGRRALFAMGDVRDESFRQQIVAHACAELGHLDILVNNAAFEWAHDPVDHDDSERLERTFRTNSESIFHLATAAAKRMQAGGAILNTTPVHSAHPLAQQRAYASYGAAVSTLTASLAQLFAESGIRVNAIAPGLVWSPRILASLPGDVVERFGSESLLRRPAQPAELAPAYVFLASDDATYITGATIPVTGGVVVTETPSRGTP